MITQNTKTFTATTCKEFWKGTTTGKGYNGIESKGVTKRFTPILKKSGERVGTVVVATKMVWNGRCFDYEKIATLYIGEKMVFIKSLPKNTNADDEMAEIKKINF